MIRWWLAVILTLVSASSLRADRDIVYSARYYTPVKSRRISHFQIYRINPDGSGRIQLTHGNVDCVEPKWSPDGKRILFLRKRYPDTSQVCIMRPDGTGERSLPIYATWVNSAFWSPDGRTVAVGGALRDAKGNHENSLILTELASGKARKFKGIYPFEWKADSNEIVCGGGSFNVLTGKTTPTPDTDDTPSESKSLHKIDNVTSVALGREGEGDDPVRTLKVLDNHGKLIKSMPLNSLLTDGGIGSAIDSLGELRTIPGHNGAVIVVERCDMAGHIPRENYHRIDLKTGIKTTIAEEMRLIVWSPDGTRCCLGPDISIEVLGKRSDGREVHVWVSQLEIRDSMGRNRKVLTPGFVQLDSCDWRKSSRH